MARQKQVDDCLDRCLAGQPQVPGHKLSATACDGLLTMYHYHHKLLVYDLPNQRAVFEWWEKPTDRRILEAALAYLKDNSEGGAVSSSGILKPQAVNSPFPPIAKGTLISNLVRTERLVMGHLGDCQLAHGDSIKDRGSIFVAHVAFPLKSEAAARGAIARMQQHSSANSADHNVSAFRVVGSGPDGVASGCDDDGEDRAGAKLLSTLKAEKALGVAVVVSRWYGGINLGKVRFQHISDTTRTLLSRCGHRPGIPMSERLATDWGVGHSLGAQASTSSNLVSSSSDKEARRELMAAAAERRVAALQPAQMRIVKSKFGRPADSNLGSAKRPPEGTIDGPKESPHKATRLASEVSKADTYEKAVLSEALAPTRGNAVWPSLQPQASAAIDLDD